MSEKSKAELIAELEKLGVPKNGRKPRSDAGKTRGQYIRTGEPRADLGHVRGRYTKSPMFYKNQFISFIASHSGEHGDDLQRDENLIFPPEITNYYQLVRATGRAPYYASVRLSSHPEALRWRWWFTEMANAANEEDKKTWEKRICDWYFIKWSDLDLWTYDEWAWAYYSRIAGWNNRIADRIILVYFDYLDGAYGMLLRDEKANTIWKRPEVK